MIGQDDELTAYRVHAMQGAGLHVIHPNTRREALRVVAQEQFDVAILSYTVESEMAHEFAELIRQNCPKCPIIAITESPWEDSKLQPDETIVGKEGPEALIEAVRRATKRGLRRVK